MGIWHVFGPVLGMYIVRGGVLYNPGEKQFTPFMRLQGSGNNEHPRPAMIYILLSAL